ncbi:YczI family protein [Bacillus yunxiaonensis]
MGLTFLIWGISEIKEKHKVMGILSLGVAAFTLFVAVVIISR